MPTPQTLNGARVVRRGKSTLLIALPLAQWRVIEGGCSCPFCSADGTPTTAYWDTLAVGLSTDYAWPVHAPDVHGLKPLRTDVYGVVRS